MEPEVSLPSSQEPVAGPYLEPDESSPHSPTLLVVCSECRRFLYLFKQVVVLII